MKTDPRKIKNIVDKQKEMCYNGRVRKQNCVLTSPPWARLVDSVMFHGKWGIVRGRFLLSERFLFFGGALLLAQKNC